MRSSVFGSVLALPGWAGWLAGWPPFVGAASSSLAAGLQLVASWVAMLLGATLCHRVAELTVWWLAGDSGKRPGQCGDAGDAGAVCAASFVLLVSKPSDWI